MALESIFSFDLVSQALKLSREISGTTDWGSPRERAQRGAAWEDQHTPGWHRFVDTRQLTLIHSETCIKGQLNRRLCTPTFASFVESMGMHFVAWHGYMLVLSDFGPDPRLGAFGIFFERRRSLLEIAWINEIERRLHADRAKEADSILEAMRQAMEPARPLGTLLGAMPTALGGHVGVPRSSACPRKAVGMAPAGELVHA